MDKEDRFGQTRVANLESLTIPVLQFTNKVLQLVGHKLSIVGFLGVNLPVEVVCIVNKG